uniref:Uncharacterized protein n=1 Tax=Oryza nivara TaxID=4536 RepID=A0A0E0FKN7_ORYNI
MAENELKDDGVRLQNRWKTGHWDMKELDASMNMLQRVGARLQALHVTHGIIADDGGNPNNYLPEFGKYHPVLPTKHGETSSSQAPPSAAAVPSIGDPLTVEVAECVAAALRVAAGDHSFSLFSRMSV